MQRIIEWRCAKKIGVLFHFENHFRRFFVLLLSQHELGGSVTVEHRWLMITCSYGVAILFSSISLCLAIADRLLASRTTHLCTRSYSSSTVNQVDEIVGKSSVETNRVIAYGVAN